MLYQIQVQTKLRSQSCVDVLNAVRHIPLCFSKNVYLPELLYVCPVHGKGRLIISK